MRFMKVVNAKAAMRTFLAATMLLGVLAAARLTAQQPSKPKFGPEHELLKWLEARRATGQRRQAK